MKFFYSTYKCQKKELNAAISLLSIVVDTIEAFPLTFTLTLLSSALISFSKDLLPSKLIPSLFLSKGSNPNDISSPSKIPSPSVSSFNGFVLNLFISS